MVASGKITLPKLRRRRRWGRRAALRLVESLAIGLPVHPVVLLEREGRPLLAVDGFRRLGAIRDFFAGRLPAREGRGAAALDRRALGRSVLRASIVRQLRPDDNPLVAHDLFERFNARLAGHEARRCAYPGRLAGLLGRLNGAGDWRRLVGAPRIDGRLGDEELILRCMALRSAGEEYRGPMKWFLSSFMHANRSPPDGFARDEEARFARMCAVLGDRIETLPRGGGGLVSPPAVDAVLAAVAGDPDACDDSGLAGRLRGLLSDPEYAGCAAHAPDDPASVRRRLALARDRLCA